MGSSLPYPCPWRLGSGPEYTTDRNARRRQKRNHLEDKEPGPARTPDPVEKGDSRVGLAGSARGHRADAPVEGLLVEGNHRALLLQGLADGREEGLLREQVGGRLE